MPLFEGGLPVTQPDQPDAACAGVVKAGEQIPVDLYIMFDQSLSMTCPIPSGGNRWDAVKTALTSFLQDQSAAGLSVGIQYFGLGAVPLTSSCLATDYQVPDVEIAALPGNGQPIIDSLNAHSPTTNTPTAAGLAGAINHAVTWKAQHAGDTVVVVLVTDGQPNACGGVPEVSAKAAAGLAKGIPTYVIGVTSPGNTCTNDQNPPNQADLDAVAAAGGTQQALIVDTTQDTGKQFADTMNQIRGKTQIPCEYVIPAPENGQKINYDQVSVGFVQPSGKHLVEYRESEAACDAATGGWHYDTDPRTTNPAKIILCPTSCSTVTSSSDIAVKVIVGCGHNPIFQ